MVGAEAGVCVLVFCFCVLASLIFVEALRWTSVEKLKQYGGKKIPPTSFSFVGALMLLLVQFVLCFFFYQSSYESVPKSLFDDALHFSLLQCGDASVT